MRVFIVTFIRSYDRERASWKYWFSDSRVAHDTIIDISLDPYTQCHFIYMYQTGSLSVKRNRRQVIHREIADANTIRHLRSRHGKLCWFSDSWVYSIPWHSLGFVYTVSFIQPLSEVVWCQPLHDSLGTTPSSLVKGLAPRLSVKQYRRQYIYD